MKYCLAIDIGASSGRHIVGWYEEGELKTREVYRFDNGVKKEDGHLVWDIDYLEAKVRKGIEIALSEYPLESLSIDTWGVDYVLLKGDETVRPVYAYRDHRTEDVIGEVHSLIPFAELYEHTGCQFQPFNTVYQLYDDLKKGRLEGV
ncbi:MAG: rhamnulokinase, partial [Erysipelotrichaceae bacterium]|nr:rhamnulokinase [Erysipelotrichaceae bacterium]